MSIILSATHAHSLRCIKTKNIFWSCSDQLRPRLHQSSDDQSLSPPWPGQSQCCDHWSSPPPCLDISTNSPCVFTSHRQWENISVLRNIFHPQIHQSSLLAPVATNLVQESLAAGANDVDLQHAVVGYLGDSHYISSRVTEIFWSSWFRK